MPTENGIGFSKHTPTKHDHYRVLLGIHGQIVKGILARYDWAYPEYVHFDITAGNGGAFDDPGSPIIFRDVMRGLRLPYRAVLIDREECNIIRLRALFGVDPRVSIYHGDHCEILPQLYGQVPRNARPTRVYGSLFVDPTGTEPDWDLLKNAARIYPKLDFFLYVSPTAFKRIKNSREKTWGTVEPRLGERLDYIGKRYWIVRDVEGYGPFQWTFLIGSNWDQFPEYTREGFYRLETPSGQRVFRTINYTCDERKDMDRANQMELPLDD